MKSEYEIGKTLQDPEMPPAVIDSVSSIKNTASLPGHRFKG